MKKGFTLVEMIAVVTILAVLMLISAIPITNALRSFHETSYKNQLDNVIAAARLWGQEHPENLPETVGERAYVTLQDLQNAGYLDKDFKNPKTGENFSNITVTIIKRSTKRFIYQISDVDGESLTISEE